MIISTFECKSFVQNSDITHKVIQSMFHCNRAYHNVLYMVIGKNLIIQSDIEPYEIPDSLRLMNSRNCDGMATNINAGDVVKIFAMYEPTKKQARIGKRSSNILIADENDRKEWVKRKFINVYEVPNKYNIEEEEYLKLVELLYDEIKELREEFRKTNQKVWSNLTISIKNDRITYTFCYDNLLGGQDEYYDHHIYWRKKYLHIEPCGKKEEKAFNKYLSTRNLEVPKSDEYITGIYLKRQVNVVKYDTTDVDENQRVDYRVAKQEESKIKNQILCNK